MLFRSIENFGVTPDIIVFGKALTNGLNPISGPWAREELLGPAVLPPGSTHSTFGANPLGAAVGLETLRMLAEDDYEDVARSKGSYLLQGLRALQRQFPIIGDVDGLGLALRIEICEIDGYTPNRVAADRIVKTGLAVSSMWMANDMVWFWTWVDVTGMCLPSRPR